LPAPLTWLFRRRGGGWRVDSWVQYGRDDLIAAGILHESGFYNESRLLRLAIGGLWQEYTERQRLTLRVRELEQRLLN
jgi:hypothetical protein